MSGDDVCDVERIGRVQDIPEATLLQNLPNQPDVRWFVIDDLNRCLRHGASDGEGSCRLHLQT